MKKHCRLLPGANDRPPKSPIRAFFASPLYDESSRGVTTGTGPMLHRHAGNGPATRNIKSSEMNVESMEYNSIPIERQKKLAVLIDADNAQARIIKNLLDEVAKYGVASVKRIYGNWTTPQLQGWKDVLLTNSIIPIQQFNYTTKKLSLIHI